MEDTGSRFTKILGQYWLGRILFLVGLVLATIPVFLNVAHGDVAWLLYAAARVADGATLYVDIVEINPPLIIWLNLPAVLLARALGISNILAFRIVVTGAIGASLVLSAAVIRTLFPKSPGVRAALLTLLLFSLVLLPGHDFGQREHLMWILVTPYLFVSVGRVQGIHFRVGQRIACVIGILAGLGLSLKPHFVPVWVALEGYLLWTRCGLPSWRRPECCAVVLVGLVYAAMIPIVTPEYLRLIQVTGTAYAEYWRIPARDLLTQPWAGLGAAVIIGMRLVRPGAETRHLCQMLLLTLLILLGGAIVQQKGWAYHFYPAHACGVLLAGVLVLEAWGRPQFVTRMAGATLSVLLLLGCGIPVVKAHVQSALYWRGQPGATNTNFGQLIRLTTKHARGERIYVFSDNLTDAFPLVNYSDVGWACRFPSLWILPGVYGGQRDRPSSPAYHTLREMTQCERYLFEAVVTDLVREKPALLFVPQPPPRLAGWNFEFDYLAYFSQDPRFVTWLQGYEIISRGEHFLLYRRRKAAQAFSSPSKNRTLGGFLRTVHGDEGM